MFVSLQVAMTKDACQHEWTMLNIHLTRSTRKDIAATVLDQLQWCAFVMLTSWNFFNFFSEEFFGLLTSDIIKHCAIIDDVILIITTVIIIHSVTLLFGWDRGSLFRLSLKSRSAEDEPKSEFKFFVWSQPRLSPNFSLSLGRAQSWDWAASETKLNLNLQA